MQTSVLEAFRRAVGTAGGPKKMPHEGVFFVHGMRHGFLRSASSKVSLKSRPICALLPLLRAALGLTSLATSASLGRGFLVSNLGTTRAPPVSFLLDHEVKSRRG